MQVGAIKSKMLLNLKYTQTLVGKRLYTNFLHVCKAVSSVSNICQHARQLLQPTQAWLVALVKSDCLSAMRCSYATFQCLLHVATPIVKLSASLVLASIQSMFLAAALMILLATLFMQTCLLVVPLACVLAPVCLLGKVCDHVGTGRHS